MMIIDNAALPLIKIFVNLFFWIEIIMAVMSYFFLTRIIKIEHDDFFSQWEKDGRPNGAPFWFPLQEFGSLGFRSYPWFMGTLWLFKTPDWVKGHKTATKMLRYYRITSYFVYITLSSLCFLLFLYISK